ncbi:MAG: elongation factor G [Phycisphaeraceae bacterium]|nr:elongation factor G [Phycisphaeraceae bacterium]
MAGANRSVRNIVVMGGSGGGKTSLIEALLHEAGAIPKAGKVEEGSTVCDYDPISKELRHSVDATVVHLEFEGVTVNLIDTPGLSDFLGRGLACMPAADMVLLVVDPKTGVDPVFRRLAKVAEERKLPRMVAINKIDRGDELSEAIEAIKDFLGPVVRPLDLPAGHGASVVDCFENEKGESDLGDVASFHSQLVDQVVEVDEKLMEQYLDGKVASVDELHDPFEKALREAHLIPLVFVSARSGAGVKELLKDLVHHAPSPSESNPRPFEVVQEGKAPEPWVPSHDPADPAMAHVFRVSIDAYVGRLAYFRVHQGTIRKDAALRLDDSRKPVKLHHLYRMQGKNHVEVDQLVAGEIGAVPKLEEVRAGSILHDAEVSEWLRLRPLPMPRPVQGLAVEAATKGTEAKLSEGLAKLELEDPTLRVEHVAATGETVLRGMGDLQLRIALRMLKERFGVDVNTHPPKIAYREAVTIKGEGHCRHKKQTGGAGQFAEVYLRVEPLPHDNPHWPLELVDDTYGGSVPRQFIPAIEKGVRQALVHGVIAGYPMQGVKVSVYDGKHHPVDSKEIAFITAGKHAFIDGARKAKPVIMEPFVSLEVSAPASALGAIASDLSSRRGRIIDTQTLPGGQVLVKATAPLGEVTTYASSLKSMTAGAGSFTMEHSHDEQAPHDVQQKLIAAFKPQEEAVA